MPEHAVSTISSATVINAGKAWAACWGVVTDLTQMHSPNHKSKHKGYSGPAYLGSHRKVGESAGNERPISAVDDGDKGAVCGRGQPDRGRRNFWRSKTKEISMKNIGV